VRRASEFGLSQWNHVGGAVSLLVVLSVVGCTTAPHAYESGPAPGVRLEPSIEILNMHGRFLDGRQVIAMPDGSIHVFLAVTHDEQVLDLLVHRDGSVERRTVAPRPPGNVRFLDAALDAAGNLHALIGGDHWVLEADGWRRSTATPWSAAGVGPSGARFVPGAPRLTWCFQVKGGEVHAPGRWDWEVIGAAGAPPGFFVYPWYSHGSRAVLVSETTSGFGPWVVLELEGQFDTIAAGVASDSRGNVAVAYERSRPGLHWPPFGELWYARIPAEMLQGEGTAEPNGPPGSPRRIRLASFSGGQKVLEPGTPLENAGFYYPIAVDPESGLALIYPSITVSGNKFGGSRRYFNGSRVDDLLSTDLGDPLSVFVPAGGDEFHMVGQMGGKAYRGDLVYMLFSHGAWSSPVVLEAAKHELRPMLVATANGAAVAVWLKGDAIVAQWIVPKDGRRSSE